MSVHALTSGHGLPFSWACTAPPAAQSAPASTMIGTNTAPNASRFSIHNSTFAIPYRDSLRDRALKKALRPAT